MDGKRWGYMTRLSSSLCPITLGWFLSRFVLSHANGIQVLGLYLLPGFVMLLYLVFGVFACSVKLHSPLLSHRLALGIVADSAFYWIVRPGAQESPTAAGYWDGAVWAGSGAGLAAVVLVSVLCTWGRGRRPITDSPQAVSSGMVAVALLSTLFTVLAFRIAHVLLRHLPNEARSTIVAGFEMHHAYFGCALFVALFFSLPVRSGLARLAYFVAYGLSSGMILDQATYVMLPDVSDLGYDGLVSRVGAVGLTAAFVGYGASLRVRGTKLWRERRA